MFRNLGKLLLATATASLLASEGYAQDEEDMPGVRRVDVEEMD